MELMIAQEECAPWLPWWVGRLDTPVWITDPDGNISYVNDRAETLLGRSAAECLGLPCHQVVAAMDASGRPFCGPRCVLAHMAHQDQAIPPVELRLGHPDGSSTWASVLPITVRAPDGRGPWLVHCALNTDRAHHIEDYLTKVALRASGKRQKPERRPRLRTVEERDRPPREMLTQRETEILRLLAEDRDLRNIAVSLHVSYATVRNHVQHLLAKLGVHSILEAVACHILGTD